MKNNPQTAPSTAPSGFDYSKYNKLLIAIMVGVIIWFMPSPSGVEDQAWQLLAIFVGTIIGCMLKPFPIGAISIIGATIAVLTKTVTMGSALSGFSNGVIWLIVMAFFLSRGVIKTGLGKRIAYLFVKKFGKSTIGLAYAIIFCDLVIAPATPSNTARAGGIIYPIIKSLSEAFGSKPEDGTSKKVGSFLVFTEFHGNIITSAMFLTAMAGNPLAQTLAAGFGVEITWGNWLMAAIVPGIISLILIPLIIYKIYAPEIKSTPDAPEIANKALDKMGPLKREEKFMGFVFLLVLTLWVGGSFFQVGTTLAAFIGVSTLLILEVLNWDDILSEKGAWDTLVWFAVLVMMASELNNLGLIPWIADSVGNNISGFSWPVLLTILLLAYFYSHYLFASATAHISAMYAAFLGVAIAGGVPPFVAAISLAIFGNLFASTTHYANGPAPILFGSGYVSQNEWWSLNAILAIPYFIIWLGGGLIWWKIIGLF